MSFDQARERMVEEQLVARGMREPRVLSAFRRVPRHIFVPDAFRAHAYADGPVPIGYGQTVSQPCMVALMVEALHLQGHERVLEIGTGSGYEAAILSRLALEVYSVERLPELASQAIQTLTALGIANVHITVSDGTLGWLEYAPYDGIVVAAGAPRVPEPLAAQLADEGWLVIPLGSRLAQTLFVIQRQGKALREQPITECVFVPLIGRHGWADE